MRSPQAELLDRLWKSHGRGPNALPLSEPQKGELDRRLDDLEAEGPVGLTPGTRSSLRLAPVEGEASHHSSLAVSGYHPT